MMKLKQWTRGIVFGISALCAVGLTIAQDEDQDVQTSGEAVEMTVIGAGDDGGPMIFSTTESFSNGESRSGLRIMSGGPGMMTFAGSAGGDFVMPAPDPWGMLSNPSVQKDLELVGDQLKHVQDLQADFAQQMKDQIGDISKGGLNKDRLKDLPELMKKLRDQQREQMEGMLLPHQIARLQQVALQTHMKQSGTAGALASDKVAEELGITNEQIDRLKKRSKEINEKLSKDMEALKEKAKDELLKELSLDQQGKLKDMMGDKYEPQSKDWEERFKRARRRPRTRTQREEK
jgi:hypothetical protein